MGVGLPEVGVVQRLASKATISEPVAVRTTVSDKYPENADKAPSFELLKGAVVRAPDDVRAAPFAEVEKLILP